MSDIDGTRELFSLEKSFTENFMNGAKETHVQSLSSEFSARRFAGWGLVVFSIIIQVGLAIWLSLDLSSLQKDITTYNKFVAVNRYTPNNLGTTQCTIDIALSSAAAPKPVASERIQTAQYKILVLVLSTMFCVFGLIALSPNPFKSFDIKAFKLSATT
jgi:hypothetical protein